MSGFRVTHSIRPLVRASVLAASILIPFAAQPVNAEWRVDKAAAFIGGYTLTNSETGQVLNTRYKSKEQAEKVAEILNKYDKSGKAGPKRRGE